MIVITGAAGFIGSCLVSRLNKSGRTDLILVDDFNQSNKFGNLDNKVFHSKIARTDFIEWLSGTDLPIELIYHIGARTDTTEFNRELLNELNYKYTQSVWVECTRKNIPLIYASSAATYGLGEFGYDDEDTSIIEKLKPLNPYGDSKNEFDKWALEQKEQPPFWVGLKFFNVYGPNEYHKGRMASVVFHAFNQIKEKGNMKLFRSHKEDFKDGEQLRDFIYVKDVVDVCLFLIGKTAPNGIYNLGTGKARTFLDLAKATFAALQVAPHIEFIDTPEDIRDKYQYFTEAKMQKLLKTGYSKAFHTLEEGISDYVNHYLKEKNYY